MIRATLPPEQCSADEQGSLPEAESSCFSDLYTHLRDRFSPLPQDLGWVGAGVESLKGSKGVFLCTTSYCHACIDNYFDNSKSSYFALRRYTSGLKGE